MITITYVMNYSSGGMGDTIRFMMSMYAFACHTPNTRFMINMQKRPDLQNYFHIDDEFKSTVKEECFKDEITCMWTKDEVLIFIKDIQEKAYHEENKDIYITSNGYGFIASEVVRKYIPSFAERVLKPSPIVEDHINNILQSTLSTMDTRYISLHIRCGDYVIPMPRHGSEKRLDISDANIIADIIQRALNIQQIFPNSYIFIHSDSVYLKNKIIEYNSRFINYPSVICHTAEEEHVNGGYLSTIAEFFFMSRASHIIQLGKYSGFSHIASLYGSTLFTTEQTNDIIESFSIY